MRVRQRERRQKSEGSTATTANTTADHDPIVVSVVSLFSTAAVADDAIAVAIRALPQDDTGASGGPVLFEVVLPAGT